MPVGCDPKFGVKKPVKNHSSAVSFDKEVCAYFEVAVRSNAILGPFDAPPIDGLCFSPNHKKTTPQKYYKTIIFIAQKG